MKITAQEEYGLRCILQIARHQGDSPTAISEIARGEGLSTQYIAKLLNRLHKVGLIASTRGIRGGFKLTRPANSISAGEVLDALGGTLKSKNQSICDTFVGKKSQCVHLTNCSIRPLWNIIMQHVTEVLNRLTIQDLINEEVTASKTISGHFDETLTGKPAALPVCPAGGQT